MKNILNKIKEILTSSRFKSFYWRVSMMVLATLVDTIIESLSDWGLSPQNVVLLGLVLGEISKYLNTQQKR